MKGLMIRALLVVSGALLIVIGGAVLFEPHAFFASNGASLDGAPSLMSEVRAPGGLLLVSGVFVLWGGLRTSASWLGLLLSALVYGTYGVSRLVSIALDGMPSPSLLAAAGVELLLGLLALVVLLGHNIAPALGAARR